MEQTSGFAKRLTKLRALSGMYLKEIACHLHISIGTMSNYENGIHQPSLEMLCRLADFYGVSTDYLLGRDEVSLESGESEKDGDVNGVSPRQLRKIQHKILKMTPNELELLELIINVITKYKITMGII
ncbi:MAG: helix-turn-helix domain-containing protein [Clostridium sp.]|nr:helix-turn-helix domain-containing protein [Acetatifactor muris]MCM1525831.1 helix-turn-helix domain-containing protein [Bacteroides sp.]MCM1562630.1 helix-turn-helix domain-containing protein [Clostridium sp.]